MQKLKTAACNKGLSYTAIRYYYDCKL